jgi:hypothetical protein
MTPPRIFVLLARESPAGVIFRRGPSHRTLLIKWNLDDDTFEFGQWLNGRVYERRCDLSPEGDLLLYFASNFNREYGSWTAVSRPPFFTALALWPKGNTYGGGGLFTSNTEILLDRQGWEERDLAPGFSVPEWLKIARLNRREGWEEFDLSSPWSKRLERDGWELTALPTGTKDELGRKMRLELDLPYTWRKAHPKLVEAFWLELSILGVGGEGEPWIVSEHVVMGKNGYRGVIGRSEWADWDRNGDLLFAQSGCLYRLRYVDGTFGSIEESERIADFAGHEFRPCEPSEEARRWPQRKIESRR